MTNSDLLDLMLDAARAASTAIMQVYLSDFEHVAKADGSPVTIADQRAETIILDKLKSTGIPVLAEESAAAGIVPTLGDRFFVVDPLDGTKEFLKRNGEFTLNIALVEEGAPVLGLVAKGEAQLYPRFTPTSEWDTAAGQAVLEAAGGKVVTIDGTPLSYGKGGDNLNPFFVAAASADLAFRGAAEMRRLVPGD